MSEQTQQQTAALEQTIVAAREAAKECGVDLDSPRIGADGNPQYPNTSFAFELDGLEDGPQLKDIEAALEELETLVSVLDRYHLFHAVRAELLRALGRPEPARDADRRALELTANPAERALLHARVRGT